MWNSGQPFFFIFWCDNFINKSTSELIKELLNISWAKNTYITLDNNLTWDINIFDYVKNIYSIVNRNSYFISLDYLDESEDLILENIKWYIQNNLPAEYINIIDKNNILTKITNRFSQNR